MRFDECENSWKISCWPVSPLFWTQNLLDAAVQEAYILCASPERHNYRFGHNVDYIFLPVGDSFTSFNIFWSLKKILEKKP